MNYVYDNKELGRRLQDLREQHGVTQQEIADCCGLSKNHISAVERGLNGGSIKLLIAYRMLLDLSLDVLVGLERKDVVQSSRLKNHLVNMNYEKQEKLASVIDVAGGLVL